VIFTFFRTPPAAVYALAAIAIPLGLLWFFGEESLPILLATLGVLIAGYLYFLGFTKTVFIALVASFLFSVEVPLLGGAALSLPAEPLALLLFVVGCLAIVKQPEATAGWAKQPVVWALALLIFAWSLSTTTSTMLQVSAKYVAINIVFMGVGVVVFPLLWQQSGFSLQRLLRWLFIPLSFFGFYAIYNLLPHGFNPGAAPMIAHPFFKDHTVFSATISLVVPLLMLWPTFVKTPKKVDWLPPALGVLLLFALFISSSRAAWLAVILAAAFYVFIRLRGNVGTLLILLLAAVAAAWFFRSAIQNKLLINPYTSTEVAGTLQDQALSVTNVTSDVSNIERLNRWKCALRMGADKPLSGFGPGTYQFQYLAYQRDADKTYISVTTPFNTILGRGGSAHSEYLLLFSESGVLGLLAWVFLQLALLITFFKIWSGNLTSKDKNLSLAIYLSVLTYTVHSLFNNYLNTAQFGIFWWIMIGALVHLAVKNKAHEQSA
jgi:O-antigen ligase